MTSDRTMITLDDTPESVVSSANPLPVTAISGGVTGINTVTNNVPMITNVNTATNNVPMIVNVNTFTADNISVTSNLATNTASVPGLVNVNTFTADNISVTSNIATVTNTVPMLTNVNTFTADNLSVTANIGTATNATPFTVNLSTNTAGELVTKTQVDKAQLDGQMFNYFFDATTTAGAYYFTFTIPDTTASHHMNMTARTTGPGMFSLWEDSLPTITGSGAGGIKYINADRNQAAAQTTTMTFNQNVAFDSSMTVGTQALIAEYPMLTTGTMPIGGENFNGKDSWTFKNATAYCLKWSTTAASVSVYLNATMYRA